MTQLAGTGILAPKFYRKKHRRKIINNLTELERRLFTSNGHLKVEKAAIAQADEKTVSYRVITCFEV